ncbi:MAG: hypothetical protein CMH31_04915 [Micavibrio sp.]|nr:hypothetical protein [Micavibrio sp.]
MQKRALIFHGTMGSPEGNWFPWLKAELEKQDYQVTAPIFPTPKNHSLETWFSALKNQISNLNQIDVVIGHSLGANLILHILENGLCKTDKAILVSALNEIININEYDQLNKSFIKNFNWDSIKINSKHIDILHGDNDPYVPIKQAQDIADGLDIKLQIIKGGGHLNTEAGYNSFPLLLDLINE